jgi:hypothetical protein
MMAFGYLVVKSEGGGRDALQARSRCEVVQVGVRIGGGRGARALNMARCEKYQKISGLMITNPIDMVLYKERE